MKTFRRPSRTGRPLAACLLAACLLMFTACAPFRHDKTAPGKDADSAASPGPDPEAQRMLADAERAAGALNRYAFTLHLTQKITGDPSDAAAETNGSVTEMEGRVETDPLKIDQTIRSTVAGETGVYRTILVPDGYYVYDPVFRSWGRLPAEEARKVTATLSDFQADLPEAIRQVAALGPTVASAGGDGIVVRYEGGGEKARAFVTRLLESALGWSSQDAALRESLEVQHLLVEMTLDPKRHWPVAYRVGAKIALASEDGSRSILEQTLTGTYREHNTAAAVRLPEEAKKAPELGPPLEDPELP